MRFQFYTNHSNYHTKNLEPDNPKILFYVDIQAN